MRRTRPSRSPSTARDIAIAAGAAAVFSGAPSTAWALASGRDPLMAARAAGTLVPGRRQPSVAAGAVAHCCISATWTTALAAVVPAGTRRGAAVGGAAGLAIAALDLGVVARAYPAIQALPLAPQVVDHVAFGAIAGAVLAGRRSAGARAR